MARTGTDPIVLFDGVCNLCNGLVRFVAANDPQRRVRFAPLQSPAAAALLAAAAKPAADGTFVLLAHGRRYERSDAALHLALELRTPWPLAFGAILLPRRWRDGAYRVIARNRYRWFGRRDVCAVPSPELRARFLDGADPPAGAGAG